MIGLPDKRRRCGPWPRQIQPKTARKRRKVAPDDAEEVTHLLPRVLDVLNSYLRVIDMEELNDPRTLVRLRAQLLRRIQIVTGDVLVRDLLVTEFVVN